MPKLFKLKWYFKLGIILLSIIITSLIPTLLMYYLGYEPNEKFNKNSIQTNCTVTNTYIAKTTCSYLCNCETRCVGVKPRNCVQNCNTCYYECFNGFVDFIFETSLTNITSLKKIYTNVRNYNDVLTNLNQNYPLGKHIICFYDNTNPKDMRFELDNSTVYFVFFIIFIVIGGIILFGSACFELIRITLKFKKNNNIKKNNDKK